MATSDNNGTFIDTLQMGVFNVSTHYDPDALLIKNLAIFPNLFYVLFLQDTNYNYQLVVPSTGLELRSRIYVEVKAVNLTGK